LENCMLSLISLTDVYEALPRNTLRSNAS
jgi:hypothetical protein